MVAPWARHQRPWGCGRSMDPEMALGSSHGPDDTRVPSWQQGSLIGVALVPAWPSSANMATSCDLDSGYPCGLWWHPGPQTWSSSASRAWMLPWPDRFDWYGSSDSVAFGHQHSPRWWPRTSPSFKREMYHASYLPLVTDYRGLLGRATLNSWSCATLNLHIHLLSHLCLMV